MRIFLDASESMTFGEPRKFDFARQVAAAIGYVALCGFDRVTVVPFPTNNPGNAPARRAALRSVRGREIVDAVLPERQRAHRRWPGADLMMRSSGALESPAGGPRDGAERFPGSGRLRSRSYRSRRHAASRSVSSKSSRPRNSNPATYGDLRLIDSESGGLQEVTFGRYRLKAYQQTVQNFIQRLREFARPAG